jgi:mannose/fructose/N-acetylgalactosamine-specific phosphotransferase system component IID
MPAFARVLARCFAVQAAWSYERMLGPGAGWAAEPALRHLEGGVEGARYREALARHSTFFNAHPYLAGLAIGAATRAEFEGEPPERIVRLREALCSPLGSVGDRLVWATWLPACAAVGVSLVATGHAVLGAVVFLVLFNAVHAGCRLWALRAGWSRGLQVAGALSLPVVRTALEWSGPLAAFCVGIAVPLAFAWQLDGAPPAVWVGGGLGVVLVAAAVRVLRRVTGVALATVLLGITFLVGLVSVW